MKKLLFIVAIGVFTLCIFSNIIASPLSVFNSSDGWKQFADDDGYRTNNGYVNPGYGGQKFDAEYLFYRLQNNIFSIGLQTGFDVTDGHVSTSGINYYSGDLALSFDGNSSNYEYAVDFGLYTKNYGAKADASLSVPVGGNKAAGIDTAGLYSVTQWNNGVYSGYTASNPFAMDSGIYLGQLNENLTGNDSTAVTYSSGYSYGGYSYYRIVSFPTFLISEITMDSLINLSAHWTMSCGNDAIDGDEYGIQNPVPEPGTMFLLGSLATGLFGFAGLRKQFMK